MNALVSACSSPTDTSADRTWMAGSLAKAKAFPSTPVRFRLAADGTILNVTDINERLGVDIRSGACAWNHAGGGWYHLDPILSDHLLPFELAAAAGQALGG